MAGVKVRFRRSSQRFCPTTLFWAKFPGKHPLRLVHGFTIGPRKEGYSVSQTGEAVQIVGGEIDICVELVSMDIVEYIASSPGQDFNLLIANAFLDLVDARSLLPSLFRMSGSRGLYWFSINFDGETIFLPEDPRDDELLRIYTKSMDLRVRRGRKAGDSRTGRHLFGNIRAAGADILAAGSSDWVVHPTDGMGYEAREAEFLGYIIDTIENELLQHPEIAPVLASEWADLRRAQVREGALVYIAHQLDFMGRCKVERSSD